MKRKWLASILMLVMLCTLVGGGTVLAVATDSEVAKVNVVSVNMNADGDWGSHPTVLFDIERPSDLSGVHGAVGNGTGEQHEAIKAKIKSSHTGNFWIPCTNGSALTETRFRYVLYGWQPEVGEVITIEAGCPLYNGTTVFAEVAQTVTYLNTAEGWVLYNPTTFAATENTAKLMVGGEKTITFTTDYNVAPVTYSVEPAGIVNVAGNGLSAKLTGVAEGTATITATLYGGKTATVEVTVEEAKTVESISIEEGQKITVYKGTKELTNDHLKGLNAFVNYEGGESSKFTVTKDMLSNVPADFNTVGETDVTVTHEGKTATVALAVVERPALTITQVGYWHASWGFNVVFTSEDNTGIVPGPGGALEQEKIDKVEIVNSQGVSIKSGYNFNYNGARFVATPNGLPPAKIGSRITVKEGFIWLEKELKQDQTFVLTAASDEMVEYDPDTHDAKSITITTETDDFFFAETTKQLEWKLSDGAAAFPSFTSSNEAIATVDENGLITGVAEGTATITATVGSGDGAKTATYELNVKPALPMDRVELKTAYKIWIEKGEDFFVPEDFTAVPVYKNGDKDFFGREFKLVTEGDKANTVIDGTVNTDEAGEQKVTLKVTYEGKTYDLQVELRVFVPVDMEIKEVAIVEWFNFASFVQFPNSTTNSTNITDTTFIPSALKFSYTRANGDVVESGVYNLGGGNIAILPAFINIMDGDNRAINLNNFNTDERFYREGDRIVLEAGLAGYLWTGDKLGNEDPSNKDSMKPGTGMAVRECVLKEQVTYIFDGSLWVVFAPTQDVKVPDGLNVILGQEKNIGARRLPAGATEGSFTYSVADESIATVNKNGRITAKKLGTTEITVTLINREGGDIVKKITLNVVDGVIELSFGDVEKITVTKGTETPNLSGIGKLVYATGKTEDADFTNAVFEGYDKNTLGEQLVTVTVTVGDEEFSATITVVVEEEAGCGCGSSVAGYASITFGAAILALAAVLMVVRKKRAA